MTATRRIRLDSLLFGTARREHRDRPVVQPGTAALPGSGVVCQSGARLRPSGGYNAVVFEGGKGIAFEQSQPRIAARCEEKLGVNARVEWLQLRRFSIR